MSSTEDKKPEYEFSIGGYKLKYSNKLMMIIIAVAPVVGGTLWGAFEAVKGYQNMQKKIESYVSPDLSEFDKRLATLEDSTAKVNDYTRDIKNDIKNDVRKLEKIVEQVERDNKQFSREVDKDLREMRKETDNKIKRALDNPLANKD
jgi:predicted RNase H-like nuclease (RuvC/YqgF family)